jgi:hypothetical protein
VAIDRRRCARATPEYSLDSATLDTVTSSGDPGPAERVEVADDLERGLPILVRLLTPLERTVLLLREVFGYSYAEIARLVGKSECNCRQVKMRARRHLQARRGDCEPRYADATRLTRAFVDAFERGDAHAAVRLVGGRAVQTPACLRSGRPSVMFTAASPERDANSSRR